MSDNLNSRPESKEEIENDLRNFLVAIKPLITAVEKNQNRSLIFTVSSLAKDVATDKAFLDDIKKCGPLLEKYKYLIDGI